MSLEKNVTNTSDGVTCIKLARPDTNLGINSLENKSVQVMHGNKIKQG